MKLQPVIRKSIKAKEEINSNPLVSSFTDKTPEEAAKWIEDNVVADKTVKEAFKIIMMLLVNETTSKVKTPEAIINHEAVRHF